MHDFIPASFKRAAITPVFKSGIKMSPCNYRPISLLLLLKFLNGLLENKWLLGVFDDLMHMTQNDTAYTRWSCHSGLANPVQIVSTPHAPSNGGQITVFRQASHADSLDGWYCSS